MALEASLRSFSRLNDDQTLACDLVSVALRFTNTGLTHPVEDCDRGRQGSCIFQAACRVVGASGCGHEGRDWIH